MTEIRPRWEWRSFGRRFGEAEARLERLTPSGIQESNEKCPLSRVGGNVKVRDTQHGVSGPWRSVVDLPEMTLLGEGPAPHGAIIDATVERTVAAIAGMVGEAKGHGVRGRSLPSARPAFGSRRTVMSRAEHPGANRRADRGDLGRRGRTQALRIVGAVWRAGLLPDRGCGGEQLSCSPRRGLQDWEDRRP